MTLLIRFIGLSCLFLLCGTTVFTQELFVRTYPQEVYLGSEQNWYFAQDKKGTIYVANTDGILKYDGEKWTLISLPDQNYAFAIGFDSRDNLFVGSYNEFGYFQLDASGRYQYHSFIGLLPEALRTVKNITQIAVLNDTVFFKGADYVYIYAGGNLKYFPSKANGLIKIRRQVFLMQNDGLHPYKNGTFEAPDPDDGLRGVRISRIKDYLDGTCLLLDDAKKLWVYDPAAPPKSKLRLFSSNLDAAQKGPPLVSMFNLDNGTIALLMESGLLFVGKNGVPVNFMPAAMLGTDLRYARIFQDARHNLWMTGAGPYIFQIITSSPLSYYDKDNGIRGTVLCVTKAGDYRYVGTTKGLFYQAKDRGFSPIPLGQGETWNIYNFQGKQYIAHETGVFELNGTRVRKLIDQASVHYLCELKRHPGCFLMGTYSDGIWLLRQKGNDWTKQKVKGYEEEVRFIQEDDEGNIWVGHLRKGVFKLQLNGNLDSITAKTLYDHERGLATQSVHRLFRLADGRLVVTTGDGIYGYNKAKDRFLPMPEFSRALPAGCSVNTIAETPDGDFYFRYSSGGYRQMTGFLHRCPGGAFELIQAPFYKMAIPTNGLWPDDDDDPLLIAGPHEIWFGAGEKLVTFDPGRKTFYDDPVRAFIGHAWNKDSALTARDAGSPPATFPFCRNSMRFDFLSSDYEAPEKVEYQYKLNGFDKKWSHWSGNREAVFTNLKEGKYTFLLRARTEYKRISEPVCFPFSISPPWYRTWWSYCLYGGCLLVLMYVLIRINARRIIKKNSALEKKVAEKTAEINEQAKALRELNATKDKLFSIISHDLRGPISTMKTVVDMMTNYAMSEEDVRAFSVELSEHLLVTGHLLNNLLFWAKTQMEGIRSTPTVVNLHEIVEENFRLFKAPAESKDIRMINIIDADFEVYADKDILKMVLRNLINNAVKFTGRGGEVLINAAYEEDHTKIMIRDTGTGLSPNEISRIFHKQVFHKPDTRGQLGAGLGLMLCMELIEKDGGSMEIESEPGKGSCFSVVTPSFFWHTPLTDYHNHTT
jgi:signal transduction histidine kinase/ligand-binding sensor domain-containing protein